MVELSHLLLREVFQANDTEAQWHTVCGGPYKKVWIWHILLGGGGFEEQAWDMGILTDVAENMFIFLIFLLKNGEREKYWEGTQ